jgi:hypothetical protein
MSPAGTHGRGYYTACALRIAADHGQTGLGDGGFTTWTAQLVNDAKERCLVSCIATERLTTVAEPSGQITRLTTEGPEEP